MQDLTDVKIFLASIIQPLVIDAVKAGLANKTTAPAPIREADELLTPKETAALLKVSTVTIWDWSKRNILNPRRIGNQVRYLKSEVLAAARPTKGGVPS